MRLILGILLILVFAGFFVWEIVAIVRVCLEIKRENSVFMKEDEKDAD